MVITLLIIGFRMVLMVLGPIVQHFVLVMIGLLSTLTHTLPCIYSQLSTAFFPMALTCSWPTIWSWVNWSSIELEGVDFPFWWFSYFELVFYILGTVAWDSCTMSCESLVVSTSIPVLGELYILGFKNLKSVNLQICRSMLHLKNVLCILFFYI